MRARNFEALSETTFDVLVVGGGIHGLATALDAAARGLTVALVEAGDFAAATSFNHQRTAHGGLRSLQAGRIGQARESIRERRALARIAPRLLRPMPFIIGTYRSMLRKSRLALRAGFRVDRWLGRHRNDGLEPELHLPPPRLTSRAATLKLFAGVRPDGLTGGANWYDYQIVHTNRLAIAFAEGADARGARLVNYAQALSAVKDGSQVAGMRVRDVLTGAEIDVRARITINAAGARVGDVMKMFGVNREVPLLKAMNLVTSKPASDIALAAPAFAKATAGRPAGEGRMLTLVPWHGRALIGTAHSSDLKQPGELGVAPAEIDAFIADANAAFPALKLTAADITLVHRGIVPAQTGKNGGIELLGTSEIREHAADGAPGAMSVIGVKYTTARAVGARAAAAAAKRLGRSSRRTDTDTAILPGAGISDHEALTIETARAVGLELSPAIIKHLNAIYGDRSAAIVRLMAERSEWRMPLLPGRPNVGAEVIHAIRDEMACTLADIAIRRSELGAAGHPGMDMVTAMAAVAAEELGWDTDRRNREVAAVDAFYRWQT